MLTDLEPRFSCLDWWEKIKAGETPMAKVPLNEKRATKALAFFNRLRLPDIAGTPLLKYACGDWFRELLVAFLASEDPVTKERLVVELLAMVPKKSSKSTYAAALGLTALYMEETPNGQMLMIAPSQNISTRGFEQAAGMVRLDPKLNNIFKIQDNLKVITRRKTGTKLSVKTFDTKIVVGEIPLLTIIDEIHELGKKAGAAQVMQQIRGGGITQAGGQVLMITTQSDKRPRGIWRLELDKAREIRDGQAGPAPIMLPMLYEFPEELQKKEEFWRDRSNWHYVLPNLNKSINQARLEADYDNNGSKSPEAEQIWVSQHLNIEIGVGMQDGRWTGVDYWEDAAVLGLTFQKILETSEVCTIGIDPGGLDDLLSMSVIGRHRVTGVWQHWGKSWADKKVLTRRKSIATELEDFVKVGELTLVDDLELEAYAEMAQICVTIRDKGLLPKENGIGVDGAGKAANLAIDALEAAKFDLSKDVEPIPQGYKLNNVSASVAIKLKAKTLVHCGQALMGWCAGNAQMQVSGNAEYPTKAESGVGKIDGVMSLFDAAELMSGHPVASGRGSLLLDMEEVVV